MPSQNKKAITLTQNGQPIPDIRAMFLEGLKLHQQNKAKEAKAVYEIVLKADPGHFNALHLLGVAYVQLGKPKTGSTFIRRALQINPDHADAHNNLGAALQELRQLEEAVSSYDQAIKLNPGFADAHKNRGDSLVQLGRLGDALMSYEKVLALRPDYDFLLGTYLNTKAKLCDWSGLDEWVQRLELGISQSKKVTKPFCATGLLDDPLLLRKASSIYVDAKFPERTALGRAIPRKTDGKIRIGYFSSDYRNHATSYLIAELLESHDKDRFELFGYSYGPNKNDAMQLRIAAAFDHFVDVRKMSDRAVAIMAREAGLDIAIDLKGFTKDQRMGIFSFGCAPVQVSYLGYPGTSGASYFDYLIADKTVIPEEAQCGYSEKIVHMPASYQVNDSTRRISDRDFTRSELGLPEDAFVYCCFNNNYKILPETFSVWMRILAAVPHSVLWLFESHPHVIINLQKEASSRGVDANRLIFASRMELEDHLARHRLADLFLDTLPYNAHTTASDALWAGLPVLTRTGHSFAGRVAASLLNALELTELITDTQDAYEALAIRLARHPEELQAIKNKLDLHKRTKTLFDGRAFARHLEKSFIEMHTRSQQGLPPEHIYVTP